MIPYMCVHSSYTPAAKEIGHKIKGESIAGNPISEAERDCAILIAAGAMARMLPKGATLIPVPSRKGYATDTLLLANAIATLMGGKVMDILRGKCRMSSYVAKKEGIAQTKEDFGFYMTEKPQGRVYYIDNVIASGATAKSVNAVYKGIFAVYCCISAVKGFVNISPKASFVRKNGVKRSFV